MNYQGIDHSRVVQRTVGSIGNAEKEFSKVANKEIPIVLVPQRSPAFFHVALNVPSGPFVLHQRWLKNMGQLNPGIIWVWPFWNRVSHVVNRATITYDAPARNCPTADNVMVNIDLSLTFRIGPDADAAANFVYHLGAHRFDELLSVQTEEAIRGLVYSVTHDQVNDLREEFAHGVLATLNSKLGEYGVQIMNVKITEVTLPLQLQQRLERTTAFKTKMGEQEKNHENKIRILEDENTKQIHTMRKTIDRKIQELQAEQKRFEIQKREHIEKSHGDARVEKVEANTEAEVALKQCIGDEGVEMVKARTEGEALTKQARVEAAKLKIEAEQKANVMVKEAEGDLKVAEAQAESMIAKAEAEAAGAKSLEEKRRYELEWARLEVMKKLAGKGRRFISGQKGDALMSDLIPSTTKRNGYHRN